MKKNIGLISLFCVFAVVVSACNFPTLTLTPTPDIYGTVTALALTQGTVGASPTLGFDLSATPLLSPTITLTLPPSVPAVSVSVDTNCRTGPGVNYDLVGGLFVGEQAEVVGKYTSVSPTYWVIRKGAVTCWLWGQYATVEGNTANIPEMVPPPSPTPTFTPTPTNTPTITPTPTTTNTPTVTP